MSEEEALKLGYVSSYACAGPDEGFRRNDPARIAVFGPEWYEKKWPGLKNCIRMRLRL